MLSPKRTQQKGYDPKNPETVLALSHDRSVLRVLQSFSQSRSAWAIQSVISENKEALNSLREKIPGLQDLLDKDRDVTNYFKDHRSEFINTFTRSCSPTQELSLKMKQLRLAYNVVARWARDFVQTVAHLRQDGLIAPLVANPNRKGPHYQAASLAAKRLAQYWFVTEVNLFGSVARGEEHSESDVDLAIKVCLDRALVTNCIETERRRLEEETGLQIGCMVLSPKTPKSVQFFFKHAGFFDATIVLYERKKWSFRVGKSYEHFDLVHFVGATAYDTYMYSYFVIVFLEGDRDGRALLLRVEERDNPREKDSYLKERVLLACNGIEVTDISSFTLLNGYLNPNTDDYEVDFMDKGLNELRRKNVITDTANIAII